MNLAIRMMVLGPVQTNCYFLINEDTKEVLIVDPADRAQKIIEWINSEGLKPTAILLTHGHFDHIMGVAGVKKEYNIPVSYTHLPYYRTYPSAIPESGAAMSAWPLHYSQYSFHSGPLYISNGPQYRIPPFYAFQRFLSESQKAVPPDQSALYAATDTYSASAWRYNL